MCGHVGIAGKLAYADEAVMKRLLVYDFFRGPDSTGFAGLRSASKEVKIAKVASHPIDLFDTKRFTDALSGYSSSVFLGHNRLATKGKVNAVNAHPFQYDHIVGAHNGTLSAVSWNALNDLIGEKTDVDSQAIFAAIAKVGIEETVKHLQGAWALVWIDLTDNSLNFLRNKERPFWYAYEKDFNKIYWASEWPIIDSATRMAPQSIPIYQDEKGFRYWSSTPDQYYKISLDALKNGFKEVPDFRVKELKGKEPAPAVNTYYSAGNNPFPPRTMMTSSHTSTSHQHGTNQSSTTTSHGALMTTGNTQESRRSNNYSRTSNGGSGTNVVELVGTAFEPFGGRITRERFAQIAQYGCDWCHKPIDFEDVGVAILEDSDQILCPSCSGLEGSSRIYTLNVFKS